MENVNGPYCNSGAIFQVKWNTTTTTNNNTIFGMSFYPTSFAKLCIVTRLGYLYTLDYTTQSSSSTSSSTSGCGHWMSHDSWIPKQHTTHPPTNNYNNNNDINDNHNNNDDTNINDDTNTNDDKSSILVACSKIANNGSCISIHPNEHIVAIGTSCGHIVLYYLA